MLSMQVRTENQQLYAGDAEGAASSDGQQGCGYANGRLEPTEKSHSGSSKGRNGSLGTQGRAQELGMALWNSVPALALPCHL